MEPTERPFLGLLALPPEEEKKVQLEKSCNDFREASVRESIPALLISLQLWLLPVKGEVDTNMNLLLRNRKQTQAADAQGVTDLACLYTTNLQE